MSSNLKKFKNKIIKEMIDEEKKEQYEKKHPRSNRNTDNSKNISLLTLLFLGVVTVVISELINWFLGQKAGQDWLTGIWNFISSPKLYANMLFSIRAVLPQEYDIVSAAMGISNGFASAAKLFEPMKDWLWIITYSLISVGVGIFITRKCENRAYIREILSVSLAVFIIKLASYSNESVNFLDLASVIAFITLNYINPLIAFFASYASIIIGSELMVYKFKNDYADKDI